MPSVIFEELGLRYYGPALGGRQFRLLTRTFEFLKTQEEPVLFHVWPRKAKDKTRPLNSPTNLTVSPDGAKNIESGEARADSRAADLFGNHWQDTLAEFGRPNQKVVAIYGGDAEQDGPASHSPCAHPDRYFDISIAEGDVRISPVGWRWQGLTPFLAEYSIWFRVAPYDMAIHDMANTKKPERQALHGPHSGYSSNNSPDTSRIYVRHRLYGTHADLGGFAARRRRRVRQTCSGQWRAPDSGPISCPLSARDFSGTGAQIKAEPKLFEIGKAEVVQHERLTSQC